MQLHLKHLLFPLLLLTAGGQNAVMKAENVTFASSPDEVTTFRPSDFRAQKRRVGRPSSTNWRRTGRIVLAIVLILGTIVLGGWLIRLSSSLLLKLLIGGAGIFVVGVLGLLFITIDAYAVPWTGGERRAFNRLRTLSEQLGMEWKQCIYPRDDHFRLGLVIDTEQLVIVDYAADQGWIIPKESVEAMEASPEQAAFAPGAGAVLLRTEDGASTAALQHFRIRLAADRETGFLLSYGDQRYAAQSLVNDFAAIWAMGEGDVW